MRASAVARLGSSASVRYAAPDTAPGGRPAAWAAAWIFGKCSMKNSTLGPVGNRASKRAASRNAVGPLPPIQMGGPPARCGLGSTAAPSSVKCLPLKLTLSRVHSARQISSVSRKRPTRRSKGTPVAANSLRMAGVSAAKPTPRMMRPSATRSSVPTTWASTTGLRSAGSSTPVPRRTRRVRAASAAINVSGSWRGRAVIESPIHTESKPAASARSAMAMSGAVSGRPDMIASRVGIRTPNSTLMVISSGAGPGVEHRALGPASIAVGQLEVVLEGGGLERAVGRVGEHDPLAAPAILVLFHDPEPLGLGTPILVDEVPEVVTHVEEHAVVPGHDGPARALGRAPVRLLARAQHRVDLVVERKAELLEVLAGRRLFLGRPVGDVEHLDAAGGHVGGELDGAGNGQRGDGVHVGVPGLGVEGGVLEGHPRLVARIVQQRLVDVENHG